MRAFVALVFLIILFPALAQAQTPSFVDTLLEADMDIAKRVENHLPDWKGQERWSIAFAILVGILGITAAGLQAADKHLAGGNEPAAPPKKAQKKKLSRFQWAVIVVGGCITGLTLIMNLTFAADHREYAKSITTTRQLIDKLRTIQKTFRQNADVRAFVRLEPNSEDLEGDARDRFNALQNRMESIHATTFDPMIRQLEDIEKNLGAESYLLPRWLVFASSSLAAEASAEANDEWQAEQNSYALAAGKLLSQLMAAAAPKSTPLQRDALLGFIDRYARKQTSTEPSKDRKRMVVHTQLTLSPSYATPALVASYLRTQKFLSTTWEQELQRLRAANAGKRGDVVYLESMGTVAAGKGGRVKLEAADPKDGSFVFAFAAAERKGGGVDLRLQSMEIIQDSLTGSTRWSFYVLSGGRVLLNLPVQRWDDSRHPTICWWDASAPFTAQATAVNGAVPITIVAIKPKIQN